MESHEAREEQKDLSALMLRKDHFVCGFCNPILGHRETDLLEDIRSDVRTLLCYLADDLKAKPEAEREPYAFTCVRRLVGRILQREQRRRTETLFFEDLPPAADSWEGAANQVYYYHYDYDGASLLDRTNNPELAEALGTLSKQDKLLLELRYNQDLPYAEIAERMHLSVDTARQRHARALEKLRRGLIPESAPSPKAHPLENFPDFFSSSCHIS